MDKPNHSTNANTRPRPVLFQEWLRFLRTTSMKGVPRIPKSEWVSLRIVWTIGVICLLIFAINQVAEVVVDYFKYETYTATEESMFHPTENIPPFPSITICNKNALSSRMDHAVVNEYRSKIHRCRKMDELDDDEQYVCHHLKSNSGLFQYLGASKATEFGHDASDLIIDCQLQVLSGIYLDKVPCRNHTRITRVVTAQYFNCYRLTLPPDLLFYGGFLAGVSLVLHLDNERSHKNKTIDLPDSRIKHHRTDPVDNYIDFRNDIAGMGAILTTQHPDSDLIPFPTLDGIELSAGFSTKIHLKIVQHKRLGEPYGKCDQVDSKGYGYLKRCLVDCFNATIEEVCDCVDIKWLTNVSSTKPDRFCESLIDTDFDQVLNRSKCARQALDAVVFQKCIERCNPPCDEDEYSQLSTMTKWPNVNQLSEFYNAFIKGNSDLTRRYRPVKKSLDCNKHDIRNKHCLSMTEAYDLISNNFLEVSYHLSDHRFLRLRDMPKTYLADICSKIGGIFNLWSGLTVIVLLELGEMLYRIIKNTDCSFARVTAHFRKLSARRNAKQDKPFDMKHYRAKYGATFGGFEDASCLPPPADI